MPETSPPPKELLKDGKSSGRTRWRDRLFSNDGWRGKNGNDREDNDEEVAQFLGGSAPRPKAEGTQTPTEIPRPKSSNTQRPSIAPLESDLGPIQDFYQKPRPPLQKGLMVSFSRTAAFIIGEGGDDADLPAQDVGKYMERSRDHEASQSSQLQRRSTGLTVPDRSRGAIPNDLSELEQTHDRFIRPYDQSSSPQRFPSRTTSQAPQYHDPTMHEMNQKPLPPVGAGASYLQPPNQHGESSPERSLHLGNSLTPTSSPQPPSQSNRRGPSPSRFQNETRGDHNIRVAATEASRTISPSPQPKGIPVANKSHNFRQIARNLGHDALDEFDARVNVVETLFRLSVSGYQDKQDIVFSKWIRAATWWFLLGRQELENAVRSRSKASREYESEQGSALPRGLMQAYVDLAKAWWIVKEVTPHHPDIKKYGNASMPSMVAIIASFGDQELAELVEVHIAIIANLRALTMSMKRNDRLPPQPFELQGQNTQIFLDYPNLPREVVNPDLSFQKATPESHRIVPIPVSDTTRHFCLGRMFAKVSLLNRHNGREEARIPCVVSTLQGKSDGDLLTGIASQDGQVDIVIRNDNHTKRATTWSQVQWSNKSHSIALALSRDLELHLLLADKDFKTLWALCDSHMNARRAFNKQEAEKITFECTLRSFERLETPHEPGAFPQGSIPGCSARVFEHDLGREDAGIPRPGSGFRLAIRTPPTTKSLCTISTDIGGEKPIFLGSCQPEDGPSLTIRSPSSPSCFLEFQSEDELETFRALICNTMKAQGDEPCKPLPLRKHTVTAALVNESAAGTGHEVFRRLPWRSLQVVSRKELEDGLSSLPPRRLQLIVDSGLGYLVDDLRLGHGDLQVSLSVDNDGEFKVFLPRPFKVTWALEDRFSKDAISQIGQVLSTIIHGNTVRTFAFPSIRDVHRFQHDLTGFTVLFDGRASKFGISRRRSVVPIHKHWETTEVRVQLLRRDKTSQLVAFFRNFHHGSCMDFEIKPTDVFETSNRSGAFLLCLVDAKFALPKAAADDMSHEFVCVDMPELPTEHDDITITFDNEEMRDRFAECLPAPVNKASRLGSLRR